MEFCVGLMIQTDKGNFSNLNDILLDMQHEHYNTINIINAQYFDISLERIGIVTKEQLENEVNAMNN